MPVTKLFNSDAVGNNHNVLDNIQGATNYINYDSDFDASYQALRNYNKGFVYSKDDDYLKIMFIPYWVNDSLSSINYDYMKLNDYSDVIKVLNEQDRLSLLAFSISSIINNIPNINNTILNRWIDTAKNEPIPYTDRNYYNNLIGSFDKVLRSRLSKDLTDYNLVNPYQIINTSENIVIVLNNNFFTFLNNKETSLIFYRDLIKEILTKIPLFMLVENSKYSLIFKKYLNLLK